MNRHHLTTVALALTFSARLTSTGTAAATNYISDVPDWPQPIFDGNGHGGSTGPWRAWCVPTATANIVGYYNNLTLLGAEGISGIGDDKNYPDSNGWSHASRNFHDDCVDSTGQDGDVADHRGDLGWYFNTNARGPAAGSHQGTSLTDIEEGIRNYFEDHGLGAVYARTYGRAIIPFALFQAFDSTCQPQSVHTRAGAFEEIMREIDAGRPLLGHWSHANYGNPAAQSDTNDDFSDADEYRVGAWPVPQESGDEFDNPYGEPWGDPAQGLSGHTMTIVGYWLSTDNTNPTGVDAIIVLDNEEELNAQGNSIVMRVPVVLPWDDANNPWTAVTSLAPAHLRHVNFNVASSGDGVTWDTAYQHLQDALDYVATQQSEGRVRPFELWVAQGTYTPDQGANYTAGDLQASFRLRDDLAIRGGFGGQETTAGQRLARFSILSGDLGGGSRSRHVVNGVAAYEATARLDRLVITKGQALGPGGGLHNLRSAMITDCVFSGNSAGSLGGGVYVARQGAPTLAGCLFRGNTAGTTGHAIATASPIYSTDIPIAAIVSNCTFMGNLAGGGATIANTGTSNVQWTVISTITLVNCTFSGNSEALYNEQAEATVINTIMWDSGQPPITNATGVTCTVSYSDIQGGWAGSGINNIGAHPVLDDPLFCVSPGADGIPGTIDDCLQLGPSSPCLDTGSNADVASCLHDGSGPRIRNGTVDMGASESDTICLCAAPATMINLLVDGTFDSGNLGAFELDSESGDGETEPQYSVADLPPMINALAIDRQASLDESHALAGQVFGWPVLPGAEIAVTFDVLVEDHNFGEYDFWNVYPANVELDYLDTQGQANTFRRSFYTFVAPGHEPDPLPVAEQLVAGQWVVRGFDLSDLDPPVAEIIRVQVGSRGWSYEVAFDNVSLLVVGLDCNGNGIDDVEDVASGTSPDENGNGIPDTCELGCPADCAEADGMVGIDDFLALLAQWGTAGACDIDGDGIIGIGDFLSLLASWGQCL